MRTRSSNFAFLFGTALISISGVVELSSVVGAQQEVESPISKRPIFELPAAELPTAELLPQVESPSPDVLPANLQGKGLPPELLPQDPPLSAADLDEIKSIRAQMGGGIAEHLKGLGLGTEAGNDRAFDSELKKVAGLMPVDAASTKTANGGFSAGTVTNSGMSVARTNAPLTAPPTIAMQKITALRSAARLLDEMAADLEDVELYEDADAIRERATKMRMSARRLLAEPKR